MKWKLLAFLVAASIPAFAVDGVVLINQSTVTAAGGFPYTISQPGSYKLSGNLTVPAGVNGIQIAASNVVLDLNGFSITGSGSLSGIFSLSQVSGITIRNGNIVGFTFVVRPDQAALGQGWTLQDLFLSVNAGGNTTGLLFGSFTRILNVTAPDSSFTVYCPSLVSAAATLGLETIGPNPSTCTFASTTAAQ